MNSVPTSGISLLKVVGDELLNEEKDLLSEETKYAHNDALFACWGHIDAAAVAKEVVVKGKAFNNERRFCKLIAALEGNAALPNLNWCTDKVENADAVALAKVLKTKRDPPSLSCAPAVTTRTIIWVTSKCQCCAR
jgi:hypothetical protein